MRPRGAPGRRPFMKALSRANSRRVALAACVALLGIAGLVAATPASAKAKGCAERVIDDWYSHADHRVHGHYPLNCYREALASLGPDIATYSDAKDAIAQALAAEALRRGGSGSGGPGSPLLPGEKPIARRNTSDYIHSLPGPTIPVSDGTPTSTAGPSSVPIPLIVLAGLAGLLLAAGGAGYVARRLKTGRGGPPTA